MIGSISVMLLDWYVPQIYTGWRYGLVRSYHYGFNNMNARVRHPTRKTPVFSNDHMELKCELKYITPTQIKMKKSEKILLKFQVLLLRKSLWRNCDSFLLNIYCPVTRNVTTPINLLDFPKSAPILAEIHRNMRDFIWI